MCIYIYTYVCIHAGGTKSQQHLVAGTPQIPYLQHYAQATRHTHSDTHHIVAARVGASAVGTPIK